MRGRARKGRLALCSECGGRAPIHDHLGERRFDFVPLWGVAVLLLYVMRRVRCPRCGVKVEDVPWIRPGSKSPTTIAMEHFLATWANHLSRQRVSAIFHVSWDRVYSAVKAAVEYGHKGQISAAITEGKNNRATVRSRMAYGYRAYDAMDVALYHELGELPQPQCFHRFA